MRYKLADGTLSTDYKQGDLFEVVDPSYNLKKGCFLFLRKDDLSGCPFFKDKNGNTYAVSWSRLKSVNSDLRINLKNLTDSERKQAEELAEKSKLPLTEWRGLKVRANPPLSEEPETEKTYWYIDEFGSKGYFCENWYNMPGEKIALSRGELFATEQDVKAYVQAMIDAGWWKE